MALPAEITAALAVANEIGAPKRLTCRYEWDRQKNRFLFRFFRRGMFIGATGDASRVAVKMAAFAKG